MRFARDLFQNPNACTFSCHSPSSSKTVQKLAPNRPRRRANRVPSTAIHRSLGAASRAPPNGLAAATPLQRDDVEPLSATLVAASAAAAHGSRCEHPPPSTPLVRSRSCLVDATRQIGDKPHVGEQEEGWRWQALCLEQGRREVPASAGRLLLSLKDRG